MARVNLLPHKQALFEIFQAEIDGDTGLLRDKCEGITYTAIDKIPSGKSWDTFISLGDFEAFDVTMGWNEERWRTYHQDIHVVSLYLPSLEYHELEYKVDEVARLVRKILKANQSLTCDSYPDGLCLESRLIQSGSVFTQNWSDVACSQTIVLFLKYEEETL